LSVGSTHTYGVKWVYVRALDIKRRDDWPFDQNSVTPMTLVVVYRASDEADIRAAVKVGLSAKWLTSSRTLDLFLMCREYEVRQKASLSGS
ncbi:hypothetical protein TSAR_012867, partial [Trichomalopsis sarcophagae]